MTTLSLMFSCIDAIDMFSMTKQLPLGTTHYLVLPQLHVAQWTSRCFLQINASCIVTAYMLCADIGTEPSR